MLLGFFMGKIMKPLFIALFLLAASPVWAACPDDFALQPPKQHEVIGCNDKADGAYHFNIFDAAHQTLSLRKQGVSLNIQYKYTGDWLITPTRIQLVPYYLEQVRRYDGKLLFEDESHATYTYYRDDRTHWLELTFVGDGIHVLKQISQAGIVLDAQYNVGQIKSRIKRYGKVVFYELLTNQASFDVLVEFLRAEEREFYIVSHVYGQQDNEQKSRQEALILYQRFLTRGVDTGKVISKGIGDLSPLKSPSSVNAVKKNTRIELVLRN